MAVFIKSAKLLIAFGESDPKIMKCDNMTFLSLFQNCCVLVHWFFSDSSHQKIEIENYWCVPVTALHSYCCIVFVFLV